jgi:putative transposase
LSVRIVEIHERFRGVYGSPRIHAELVLGDGERLGRKRVERLMRAAGISGLVRRRRGRTTIRVPGVRVAEDLVDRAFAADGPDRLWVADITYLGTWEGWLYLAAVQDVFSRRIVGWSMAEHMRAELVLDALGMALEHRRPAPGLIHHSDQGSQYVSLAFGQTARAAGIAQSMGSRGDCFDNAVAESFFATLKKELVNRRPWPTKAELRSEICSGVLELAGMAVDAQHHLLKDVLRGVAIGHPSRDEGEQSTVEVVPDRPPCPAARRGTERSAAPAALRARRAAATRLPLGLAARLLLRGRAAAAAELRHGRGERRRRVLTRLARPLYRRRC